MSINHQELRDGNQLIKDLMGSTIKINQDDVKDIPLAFLKLPDLKFHLSWKWLMPVVIRIEEDEDLPVRIEGTSCTIGADEPIAAEAESKMNAVWKAVVSYLKQK